MRSPTLVGGRCRCNIGIRIRPQLGLPLDRQPVLVGAAPQVSALGGEVRNPSSSIMTVERTLPASLAHRSIQHAAGCVKIRDAPPVQQAIVAAEVGRWCRRSPRLPSRSRSFGGEGLHRVVGEL